MENELRNLLREWTPETPSAHRVRGEVWRRIEMSDLPRSRALAFFAVLCGRPAFVAAVVFVAAAAGVVAGTTFSEEAQKDAYLQSVSAFARQ